MTKSAICLIGMAGVGKSTVGRQLADMLEWPFIDTDDVLRDLTQSRLQTILDAQGLDAFLRLESDAVSSVPAQSAVIATGGSVVYSEAAMQHLESFASLVYLSADLSTIHLRLQDASQRGLACRPGQGVDELLAERLPLYRHYADLCVDVDERTPEAVAHSILESLAVN